MKKISLLNIFLYFFCCISLLLSFYLNEDGSYSPLSGDFKDTWPYVLSLKENILSDPSGYTVHYPLHYFLLSRLSFFISDPAVIRFFLMLIAMTIPFIFFICINKKFDDKSRNVLFIICLSIFFIPAYRYSSIWANDRITTDIFILIGTYFFFQFDVSKKEIKYLYFCLLFFALACYSRQFYTVYYALFLIYIFKKSKLKNFFYLSIYSFILSLPGFYLLFKFPYFFSGLAYSGNIFNTLLGNVSSLFVYTLPIILINTILQKNNFFEKRKLLIYFIITLIVFSISYFFHDLETMGANGGAFFIFSKLIFNNYYFFYFIFTLNFFLILIIFEKYIDRFIVFSFVFIFCSIIVPQSVFEPLFFFFFFLFSKSKFKNIFLESSKASYFLLSYYIFYYFISRTDVLYKVNF